jgi:para-nitrobenzyl esterase
MERWVAFQSDRIFHYPAVRLTDLQCVHEAQTYSYLFEWSPPVIGSRLGACHGLDIPFVFGTLRHPLLRPVWGSTRSAYRLSTYMQRSWVAFARTGCPAHDDLPEWPAYTPERRSTVTLGTKCDQRDDPHERARNFWGDVIRDTKIPWAGTEAAAADANRGEA